MLPSAGAVSAQAIMQSIPGLNLPTTQELYGTTQFPTSSMRTVPTYRKDIGPRLGFAYAVRFEDGGARRSRHLFWNEPGHKLPVSRLRVPQEGHDILYQHDFATQSATLENPFPSGFTGPQDKQYGALANWGYHNNNDLGTTAARDADIYQWNLGIQRELPSQIVSGRGLRCQPEHASALGWHKQPGFHPVVFAGADFSGCACQLREHARQRPWILRSKQLRDQLSSDPGGQPVCSMFNPPCATLPTLLQ